MKIFGMCIDPTFEFIDQTTLAQPRIAFDDDDGHTAIDGALLQRVLDDLEFRFAPNHSSRYAFDASSPQPKCPWSYSLNQIRLQRLAFPFDSDRPLDYH